MIYDMNMIYDMIYVLHIYIYYIYVMLIWRQGKLRGVFEGFFVIGLFIELFLWGGKEVGLF